MWARSTVDSAVSRLIKLRVENLALISEAEMELSAGLNVLTGETGAGKTMLAKALEALLGAKTTKGVVRPGAEFAYIEATFLAPESFEKEGEIAEILQDCDGEVVLARRIASGGRSRCLVGGRTVSLETLRELAGRLIAFYGQHEGRKLMMEQAQVGMLDRSGNGKGAALRGNYQQALAEAKLASRQLKQLSEDQQSAGRELELSRFELSELAELEPQAGEEKVLMDEFHMLTGASGGQQACSDAFSCLDGEQQAVGLLLKASKSLSGAGPAVAKFVERLEAAHIELSDLAVELDSLASSWESDPARQAQVESRLSLYARLARKHGVEAEQLVEVKRRLEEQVAQADLAPELLAEAQKKADLALAQAGHEADLLSGWRSKQAPLLAKAVSLVLQELAMEGAVFEVDLERFDSAGLKRFSESGQESVVFKLQANPGLPCEPISQVASGGEVSRLMLALVAEAGLEGQAVMVLDEPDTGIGGQTAHGVAARLESLGEKTQLLVISHLPQIAARADSHFRLVKETDGATTQTRIEALADDEAVVDELCRMAGHDPSDLDARRASEKMRG